MSKQQSDNPEWEKQLQDAYSSVSDETTGEDLDASILQMAEQCHAEEKTIKTGFWNRLFRSNFVKYGVSTSFALLMTVGIARLMVHLGKTDHNINQEIGVASVEVDSGVAFSHGAKSETSHKARSMAKKSANPELMDSGSQEQKNIEPSKGVVVAEKPYINRPISAIELSDDAENFVAESNEVLLEVNKQAPKSRTTELADEHDAGILDEAVLGYPLPEVWLEEIEALLLQKDELKTLESWQQFKNTYPDYKVPSNIYEQIERLQSIGKKMDNE